MRFVRQTVERVQEVSDFEVDGLCSRVDQHVEVCQLAEEPIGEIQKLGSVLKKHKVLVGYLGERVVQSDTVKDLLSEKY